MKPRIYVATLSLILMAAMLFAQQEEGRSDDRNNPRKGNLMAKDITTNPPKPDINNVMDNFFPPEMIMRKQKEIGLSEEQQKTIKEEMKNTLSRFTELEWERNAEEETMITLARQSKVDEKNALAQFDKLLALEHKIKKVHLEMLIRVKNILTEEQQNKLLQIRRQKESLSDKRDRRQEENPPQGQSERPRPPKD